MLNWFSPQEYPPDPFVSVLVYMPGEAPLPQVHEGYMSDEGVWWSNGYFRTEDEIKGWAHMPQYEAPSPKLSLVMERTDFLAGMRSAHRRGFVEGFSTCYNQKEVFQMSGRLELEKLPQFQERELKNRMDAVFELIDEGKSPVVIHMESGKDFLVFGWEDYFERFGMLYTESEIEAIQAACRAYREGNS